MIQKTAVVGLTSIPTSPAARASRGRQALRVSLHAISSPCEANRAGRREVFDDRRPPRGAQRALRGTRPRPRPHSRGRRRSARARRGDPPVSRKHNRPVRRIARSGPRHHERCRRLEEGELERHLERLTEDWQLGVEEIDALLVKDPCCVRRLGLPKRMALKQWLIERGGDDDERSPPSRQRRRPPRRASANGGPGGCAPYATLRLRAPETG